MHFYGEMLLDFISYLCSTALKHNTENLYMQNKVVKALSYRSERIEPNINLLFCEILCILVCIIITENKM